MKTPQRYISEVPTLLNEWDWEKNKDASPYSIGYENITPNTITDGSNKRVWWICSSCKFEWQSVVAERNKGHCGCPKCKHLINKCK